MSLKQEDLLEENIKESRLLQRLLLATTLVVLALGIGRDDARRYQAAYRELDILTGLKSSDYMEFAKRNIPRQSVETTDQVTILLLSERMKKAYDERNFELAARINRAQGLATSLSFFPLSTPIDSPLQSPLQQIRASLVTPANPYIFEPDYVELVSDIEKILGVVYDASYSVHVATWSGLDCAPAQQEYAKCSSLLTVVLDRSIGKARVVVRTVTVKATGTLTSAYTATFESWIESTHPELLPFDKTEPLREKIGMGYYRHPLPRLTPIWDEVEEYTVPAARAAILKRLDEQLPRVTLFGVSIGGEWAYLAAVIALLLLSATTLAQFQNLLCLLREVGINVRRYPWAVFHANRFTALTVILTVALLPTLLSGLVFMRAFEGRLNADSVGETFKLLKSDRSAVKEAEGAPYFEIMAADTRDRLRANEFFGVSFSLMILVTLASGIGAGTTLYHIRSIAGKNENEPATPAPPRSEAPENA